MDSMKPKTPAIFLNDLPCYAELRGKKKLSGDWKTGKIAIMYLWRGSDCIMQRP